MIQVVGVQNYFYKYRLSQVIVADGPSMAVEFLVMFLNPHLPGLLGNDTL